MKMYQVTVVIESNSGEEFMYERQRCFSDDNQLKPWVDGFESGAAIVHDGAVVCTDIRCLGDYASLQQIRNTKQSGILQPLQSTV